MLNSGAPRSKRGAPKSPLQNGSSSIGRASVSKTECWGFESLLPCHFQFLFYD
jgi:hypothetical protein